MIDLNLYGSYVSFDTYAVNKLGDIYKNVLVMSILDFDTASMYADVKALAINVYPSLPEGTHQDYTKYNYLKLKHSDGSISVVALEWIKQQTITVLQNLTARFTVNIGSPDDMDKIRNVLLANNIQIVESKVL